jgi:dUTPase
MSNVFNVQNAVKQLIWTRVTYDLPPQGIVLVISQEAVIIPKNIAGFAMVKTGLCNDGVLAINIGILDPNYSGPISSFLINFGKNKYALREGSVFLRLTFFEYDQQHDLPVQVRKSDSEYVGEKKVAVVQNFSATFLDLRATIQDAAEQAFSRYQKTLFVWLPVIAVMLALLTFFLNLGNSYLAQPVRPSGQTSAELVREQLDGQIRALTDRVNALQSEVASVRKGQPAAKGGRTR